MATLRAYAQGMHVTWLDFAFKYSKSVKESEYMGGNEILSFFPSIFKASGGEMDAPLLNIASETFLPHSRQGSLGLTAITLSLICGARDLASDGPILTVFLILSSLIRISSIMSGLPAASYASSCGVIS